MGLTPHGTDRARLPVLLAGVLLLLAACTSPGAWSDAGAPDGIGTGSMLTDVACWSATGCLAAGTVGSTAILTATWDGTGWTRLPEVPVPGEPATRTDVRDVRVDCTGAGACALVATVTTSGGPVLVLARWNGTAWSASAPSPSPAGPRAGLSDVACGASDSCLAVGYRSGSSDIERFAQRWDGRSWSEVPAPPAEPDLYRWQFGSRLSCASATSCAFLHYATFPDVRTAVTVHRWDGAAWTATSPPVAAGVVAVLTDIDCTAPNRCVATGWRFGTGAMAMRWTGAQWVAEGTAGSTLVLQALSCTGDRCLAITPSPSGTPLGRTATVAGLVRTGTAWAPSGSAVADSTFSAQGVSCADTACLVVGYRSGDGGIVAAAVRRAF